jgi:hypothetical protein
VRSKPVRVLTDSGGLFALGEDSRKPACTASAPPSLSTKNCPSPPRRHLFSLVGGQNLAGTAPSFSDVAVFVAINVLSGVNIMQT